MPLKKGRSTKVIASNIKEMIDTYKKTGKLGNSKPRDFRAARKQAIAAAYRKAGRSRK